MPAPAPIRRGRRAVLAGLLAVSGLAATLGSQGALAGPVAAAHAVTVGVTAPSVDAPGAIVPAVVSAAGVGPRSGITLGLRADAGAVTRCVGGGWYNPIRRTLSRTCYVRTTKLPGTVRLVGVATGGVLGDTRRTSPAADVRTRGYVTEPLTWSQVERIGRCHNSTDRVWLTFDDGYVGRARVESLLATLAANRARARFFLVGQWARDNPALVRLIVRAGHHVGNHSTTHPVLTDLSARAVAAELAGGARVVGPRLLRPPYGAGAYTARIVKLAGRADLKVCRWTTDTRDWEATSAGLVVERVRYGDRYTPPARAGGNVLLHLQGRYTAAALQGVIDAVRQRGLELEPLP